MWPHVLNRQPSKSLRHARKESHKTIHQTMTMVSPTVERLEDRRVLASWSGTEAALPPLDVSVAAETAGPTPGAATNQDQLGGSANGGGLGLALRFGGQQGQLGGGPDVHATDELMSVLGIIAAFGESHPGAGLDSWVGMGRGGGYHQPDISSPASGLLGQGGMASGNDGSSFFTPRPPTSGPSTGPDMGMIRNVPPYVVTYTDQKGNAHHSVDDRDGPFGFGDHTYRETIRYSDGGTSYRIIRYDTDGSVTEWYTRYDERGHVLVSTASVRDFDATEPDTPPDMVLTLEEVEGSSETDGDSGDGDRDPDETEYPVPDDGSGDTGGEPSESREARKRLHAQILGRTPDGQGNPADVGDAFYDGWLLGMRPPETPTVRDMTTHPGVGDVQYGTMGTASFDQIVTTINREQDGQPAPSE